MYRRVEEYVADVEWLVKGGVFDYVEGFAFVNRGDDPANGWESVPIGPGSVFEPDLIPPGSGPLLYCLELALHHDLNEDVEKVNRLDLQGHSRHSLSTSRRVSSPGFSDTFTQKAFPRPHNHRIFPMAFG